MYACVYIYIYKRMHSSFSCHLENIHRRLPTFILSERIAVRNVSIADYTRSKQSNIFAVQLIERKHSMCLRSSSSSSSAGRRIQHAPRGLLIKNNEERDFYVIAIFEIGSATSRNRIKRIHRRIVLGIL